MTEEGLIDRLVDASVTRHRAKAVLADAREYYDAPGIPPSSKPYVDRCCRELRSASEHLAECRAELLAALRAA